MDSNIYSKVAIKLGISKSEVRKAYSKYWGFILDHIVNLPVTECKTEEDFKKMKKNFKLPNLGMFYIPSLNSVKFYGKRKGYVHKKRTAVAEPRSSDGGQI